MCPLYKIELILHNITHHFIHNNLYKLKNVEKAKINSSIYPNNYA